MLFVVAGHVGKSRRSCISCEVSRIAEDVVFPAPEPVFPRRLFPMPRYHYTPNLTASRRLAVGGWTPVPAAMTDGKRVHPGHPSWQRLRATLQHQIEDLLVSDTDFSATTNLVSPHNPSLKPCSFFCSPRPPQVVADTAACSLHASLPVVARTQEQMLWRWCFYSPIEEFRKLVRKRNQPDRAGPGAAASNEVGNLQAFLRQAMHFYLQ